MNIYRAYIVRYVSSLVKQRAERNLWYEQYAVNLGPRRSYGSARHPATLGFAKSHFVKVWFETGFPAMLQIFFITCILWQAVPLACLTTIERPGSHASTIKTDSKESKRSTGKLLLACHTDGEEVRSRFVELPRRITFPWLLSLTISSPTRS